MMKETLTLIEKTAILKSSALLGHIPTEALAQLAARGRELHFDAGSTIFREGDANRGTFLIVEGMVEMRKGRALDSMRRSGQGFGELGLLEGEPHEFTAIATEHTHALNISNEDFFDAILDYPEVGLAMVRGLSKRLAEMAQRIHDLEGQVAHLSSTIQGAGLDVPSYVSGAYRRPQGLGRDQE